MAKPLKIAFDAKRLFHNREGLGSYARTLVADLKAFYPENEYYLCTTSVSHDYCDPDFCNPNHYTILTPPTGSNASLWRNRGVVKDLQEHEIDVYFGLTNELPMGIEKLPIKTVVMLHDLIYKTFPKQFSLADRWIYARKFKHVSKCADLILATSEHTKADIIKHQGVAPEKIKVAYQSVAPTFRNLANQSQNGDYYLMVGSLNERKNQLSLIKAYALLDENQRKPVVIVGKGKSYKAGIVSQIESYGLGDFFTFKENVDTEELVKLYRNAIALIFPSRYEGFGIPILEAFYSGIPVIALRNSSLPEIVAKYGIIIEYDSPVLLNEAMEQMNKEDVRSRLLNGVEEHLEKFDPSRTTEVVMSALKS